MFVKHGACLRKRRANSRQPQGVLFAVFQGFLFIIGLAVSCNPARLSAQESAIIARLQPYSDAKPRIAGLEPGVTLSQTNAQLARAVLPEEVLRILTAGDFTLTIQDTTDLPLRQSYIDATIRHAANVALDGSGSLQNYQGGVPFPLLDPVDPQAGEKLAWNLRYRDLGETLETWPTTREVNASGGVEHFDRGIMRMRFGVHRATPADNDPQWQRQGVFFKNSFELLAPSDREGVLRILTMYDDDTRSSEQLRYSPQTRRTRKEYVNYLTPIGGAYEVLQEENPPSFFHGYLHLYHWTYRGARLMLMPGFAKTAEFRFGGKNGWYPEIPWELRHILVLESLPKSAHPFGRRVYFLDQQTYAPLLILAYTPTGEFFRLLLVAHAHPAHYPGNERISLPVLSGAAVINYARQRATLFTTDASTVYNRPLSAQRFSLMEIFRRGK
jgi:hypothetical protein